MGCVLHVLRFIPDFYIDTYSACFLWSLSLHDGPVDEGKCDCVFCYRSEMMNIDQLGH